MRFAPTLRQMRDLFVAWEGKPLFGLNDLTTDDQGSIWSGTFGCDIQKFDFKSAPPPGALFRIDPPGTVTKLWEGVEVTNGLGFIQIGSSSTIVIRPRMLCGPTQCVRIARSTTAR